MTSRELIDRAIDETNRLVSNRPPEGELLAHAVRLILLLGSLGVVACAVGWWLGRH